MSHVPLQVIEVCSRFGVQPAFPLSSDKVGVALETLHLQPLNALRHKPVGGTCGWYIWGGETLSSAPDFFSPLHFAHLAERLPHLLPYLGLPPGWRVLISPNYEDVWSDESLLENAG